MRSSNFLTWSYMIYCFDLDGTLCETLSDPDGHNVRYWESTPYPYMIEQVNKLYDEGDYIIYFTARAMGRFSDQPHSIASVKAEAVLFELTQEQLKEWGCKYHELIMGKPHADLFIDDKGINSDEFFRN